LAPLITLVRNLNNNIKEERMGTCNFKAEKETDNISGKLFNSSHFQVALLVLICGWEGGLWQSVEGRAQEGS
jgi:hypothetical protein